MDMSVADYLAIAERNGSGNTMIGNAGFLWVILIFLFFLGFSGNGLFGRNNNEVMGLSQLERDTLNSASATQRDILTSTCGTQKEVLESRFVTQLGFQNIGAQLAGCCCDLKTAIHAEGEETRALIQSNTIQELRDNLQAAQLQLGNFSQTQTIVNQLRPYPTPAYLTCSPYANSYAGIGGCGYYNGNLA